MRASMESNLWVGWSGITPRRTRSASAACMFLCIREAKKRNMHVSGRSPSGIWVFWRFVGISVPTGFGLVLEAEVVGWSNMMDDSEGRKNV